MTAPKRSRGRPPTTGRGHDGPRLNLRFSPEEMERLETRAAERHQTPAAYVREVVLDALDR